MKTTCPTGNPPVTTSSSKCSLAQHCRGLRLSSKMRRSRPSRSAWGAGAGGRYDRELESGRLDSERDARTAAMTLLPAPKELVLNPDFKTRFGPVSSRLHTKKGPLRDYSG